MPSVPYPAKYHWKIGQSVSPTLLLFVQYCPLFLFPVLPLSCHWDHQILNCAVLVLGSGDPAEVTQHAHCQH